MQSAKDKNAGSAQVCEVKVQGPSLLASVCAEGLDALTEQGIVGNQQALQANRVVLGF